MPAIARTVSLCALTAVVALPQQASAKRRRARDKTNRVVPKKKTGKERRAERKTRDFSEGGTRRGALELTLGSLVTALSAGLIGRGIWELVRGQRLEDECASGESGDANCEREDPSRGNKIAAGVSFGLAPPIAVAGAFLLARGVRIEKDYKKHHPKARASIAPLLSRRTAGLTFRVRF